MPIDPSVETAVDVLHGISIPDPYRWLEDQDSPETRDWIRDQGRRHDLYFSQVTSLKLMSGRVGEYLGVDVVDQAAKVGDRLFFRRRLKRQEQAAIYVRDLDLGTERMLVDPSPLGEYASVRIHRVASDGDIVAYELKRGGSDASEIHFVRWNGEILQDYLPLGYARGLTFSAHRTGFYYCHEAISAVENHEIRYHPWGSLSQDPIIYARPRETGSRLSLLGDHLMVGALYTRDDSRTLTIRFAKTRDFKRKPWVPIWSGSGSVCRVFVRVGRIFLLTNENAPNSKVIEVVPGEDERRVVVPESEHLIHNLASARGCLYVQYLMDRCYVIERWSADGARLGLLHSPPNTTLEILPSLSANPSSMLCTTETFGQPKEMHEYQREADAIVPIFSSSVATARHAPCVSEIYYRSSDGTEIPIYLLSSDEMKSEGPRPTILTGYGGFGVLMTPRFSVMINLLVELGAVVAIPVIRGGAEFGRAWHEAARGRRRQVAVDDFIAAACCLKDRGITNSHFLGAMGGSNGGLLVAAAMTQRPELFRAVVCIAPLLDMIRYQTFDSASKWQHEYGKSKDREDFQALYAYSPYHNIRLGERYPAIFFVTGDKDDRCNPAHVRKMAAYLQNCPIQVRPVLVDYNPDRGHSPALSVSDRCASLARRIAFFCKELSMRCPQEAAYEASRD